MNGRSGRAATMMQVGGESRFVGGTTGCRAWLGALVLMALWLGPGVLRAQVAVHFDGPGGAKIRAKLIKRLPEGVTVIAPADFAAALGRDKLGEKALKPGRQKALVAELTTVGEITAAQLIVVGLVKSKGRSLWVMVLSMDSSGIQLDKTYTIRKMVTKGKKRRRKKVPGPINLRSVKKALAPIFATLTPPPPTEEIVAVAGAAQPSDVPPESAAVSQAIDPQRRKSGASIEPQFFITGRRLSFLARNDNVRGYRANAISMVGANAELYPGVLFGIDAIDWLGVGLRFATALGLSSQPRDDPSLTVRTAYWVMEGYLRPRLSFGPVTLAAVIGVGGTTFEFGVPEDSTLVISTPGVSYVYLRGGIEALVMIGPVSIFGGGSYVHNFSIGSLGTFFPSNSTTGFSIRAGGAFQILDWLEVRAAFDYTQIHHEFEPEAGAFYQAQSATDQLYGGNFGVVLFYPP